MENPDVMEGATQSCRAGGGGCWGLAATTRSALPPLFYRGANEALRNNLLSHSVWNRQSWGSNPDSGTPEHILFWALPCTLATPQAFSWLPFFPPLHQALQIRYISFCLDHLEGLCFFRVELGEFPKKEIQWEHLAKVPNVYTFIN